MSVCYSVTASPAKTIGSMTLIFWHYGRSPCKLADFVQFKVKKDVLINSTISSLDNPFRDSVGSIFIDNQAINPYGEPEANEKCDSIIL